ERVVHLAAATGRASAETHHLVNARGTETLVEASRAAGITDFLFISSIAVTFPDLGGYPYADAKLAAERSVRESGLRFLIVRPTIILGPGAPILEALGKLATLPVAILPGNGRASIEPVHVDDVADALVAAATQATPFRNETVTLAGPERLSMEGLLRGIRHARLGRSGPLVRVPLPFFQAPLRLAGIVGLARFVPFTTGQLSSF